MSETSGNGDSVTRTYIVTVTQDRSIDPIEVADYLLDHLCDNDDPDCFYLSCDSVDVGGNR